MKKRYLLLVVSLVFIFSGCFNEKTSYIDEKVEISKNFKKLSKEDILEIKNDTRALAFNGYIYGFLDSQGYWKTGSTVNLYDGYGAIWIAFVSNKPGYVQYASMKGYTITNELVYSDYDSYPDDNLYVKYYYILTSDMRSHCNPIINASFYTRYTNGSSFIQSTKTFTLYPLYN